jgi:hypothetical protein
MISVCYNYSTNDFCYLDEAIKEASKFSDDIHITYMDKFFDGSDENEELINKTYELTRNRAKLAEIQYNSNLKYNFNSQYELYKYFHNYTRLCNYRKSKHKYILFLDSDEIVDGDKMKDWLSSINLHNYNCYVFSCYWYFRNKNYQSKSYECAGTLVNRDSITESDIMDVRERGAMEKNSVLYNILSLDNKPMINHYSWAKGSTDEECKNLLLKKVSSWGHTGDKDWASLIEDEFSRPFNGTDFVHGYEYNIL